MRILLIPFSGGVGLGPLTRCLAVAEEGKRRGYEVAFLGKPFFKRITDGLGFKTYLAPDTVHLNRKLPKYRLSDIALEYGLINLDYLQKAVKRELEIIKLFRPDIIFTETQFSINFSSAASGVPWATAVSWTDHSGFRSPLYKTVSTYPKQLKHINRFASWYNLKPYDDLCDLAFARANVKIAPTSPELQPELLSIPDVYFVGSLLSKTLEDQSNGIKLPVKKSLCTVYVYMSPGEIPANQWVEIICEAFRDQQYNVIVMLAPLKKIPKPLPKLSNVHFLPLSPAQKFLAASDAVITHGGGNTVVSALLHGKPLLVFPHDYAERDYNGRAVERLGAGLNLPTSSFASKTVRVLVEKITQDSSFARNAKTIGKSLKKLGGAQKTVDILESYCRGQRFI